METLVENKLTIQAHDRLIFLAIDEIVCFSSDESSWHIHDIFGNTHRLHHTYHSENILALSSSLIMVNQSAILNTKFLHSVETTTMRCNLNTDIYDHDLIFSHRCYKKFLKK